jgi:ATP-binding cassette subfamily F protein 3
MEKIDRPENAPGSIRIKFRSGIISGNDVIFVEGLTKHFPGNPLFDDISFNMKRNERTFILGPNGCGKSTLLKIISGRAERTSGDIEFGHKITIGYYDQELSDLSEMNTIIDEVWNDNEKLTHTEIRSVLAAFLFTGEDVFKKISVLSGGEKSRVALAKLMLSGSNFLLLDEPTNHLDINSREALEEALLSFDGTILAVSHDRYFIGKLATRVFEFSYKKLNDYKGDYQYYLDHRKKNIDTQDGEEKPNLSPSKLQRMESKEEKARKKRLERQLNETESEILRLETRLTEINHEMGTSYSDHIKLLELDNEKSKAEARLEDLLVLWESLQDENEQKTVN